MEWIFGGGMAVVLALYATFGDIFDHGKWQ